MPGVDRRAVALVAALAVAVHLPSLANGFAWDDPAHVVENESLHGLDRIGEVVTSPYLRDTHPTRSPYRPATSASYALSWAAGGGHPFAFHLFNVLAHAGASALVLLLLGALGAPGGVAAVAAALFAAHPVHVEAVANVVGRGDVLMTLGALLAALLYLRREVRPSIRVPGILLGCALAAASKENGVAVPALLLAVEVFRPAGAGGAPARAPLAERLRREAPVLVGSLAVVAAYLAARWAVLGTLTTLDVAPYIAVLPEPLRVSTAVANLSEMARLLVFPAELSADYGPAVILPAGWTDPRFVAGAVVAAGAGVLAWISATRGSGWVALGVAWAAVAHLPVSNLLVEVPIWLAERTLYLPSVGVALAVPGVWAAARRKGSERLRLAAAGGAALLVLLGSLRSWERSRTWRSTETVMASLVEEHPESFRSQWWLARELLEAGLGERAVARYREAVALNPNDAFVTLDFARALILTGRPREAEEVARGVPPGLDPSRSVYLAQALIEQGRTAEAREVVVEGLRRFPGEARLLGQAEELGPAGG